MSLSLIIKKRIKCIDCRKDAQANVSLLLNGERIGEIIYVGNQLIKGNGGREIFFG